ncbi:MULTISPECIES: TonB-system energizer ExbB [Arcobacter]|jgi:biopolymer transport protein ExbB|uniref:TonB system transport protein ExbB n=1 Tax=Arcobacter defluvii TaxID=873191 RepID=A0AAE7BET9_9BACT|nr:TonB system transport protein ExbB [Arcobacter defluvii]BAK73997.1 biopolymer transport protein [Arcobacter sp. L]
MIDTLKIYIEYSIIGVLALMSFLTLWFAFERYFFLSKIKLEDYKKVGELENDLTKNITTLYTIASNAPYIGLFGTVCGIMITFYKISESSNFDTNSVMMGLALALKATALGILVAIFTTIIYNAIARKIDVLMARWRDLNES